MEDPEKPAEPATMTAQLRALWERISPRNRVVVAVALVATAVFVAAMSLRGSVETYSPLYTGLSPEDAGDLILALKEKGVPYKVGNGGTSIEVPKAKIYELRIELASSGHPRGGAVGFEIFDQQTFGTTTFVEQVNYRRALQGELTRSITAISAVKTARVHIAMGKRSVFRDSEEPPSASVALRLAGGRSLNAAEVRGIVNLVASSVDGLDAANVVVIDERGRVLSNSASETADLRVSEVQKSIESSVESRVSRMLDRVVGVGNAAVAVTAELDFSRVDKTEERFDKENIALRSEVRNITRDEGTGSVGGIAGARANLDGTATTTTNSNGNESQLAETRNFEVPRVLTHTVGPTSSLVRLHVAVLVNHKKNSGGEITDDKAKSVPETDKKNTEDAANDNNSKKVALTPEEMEVITTIVREAAGINDERGDSLVVKNVLFEELVEPAPEELMAAAPPFITEKVYFVACAILGLILIFVILLMIRRHSNARGVANARGMALPARISDVQRVLENRMVPNELSGQQTQQQLGTSINGDIYDRVVGAVRADTGHAALVISALLDDDTGGKS